MEKIKMRDINLSALQKLQSQGTLSTIYTDGNLCYKILDGLYPTEKQELYYKFLDMEGIHIDSVLFPKDLIIENGILQGYTMNYFENSTPLSDKFLKRYFNCKDLLFYVDKASKILRDIHRHGIIYQDLSFENILVNNEGNIVFCDIDGCRYKNHSSPFFSVLFKNFFVDYRKLKISSTEDVDKISMILSFYLVMYNQVLQKITKKQYDILSEHIYTLENLKPCVDMLVHKKRPIKDVPYLDELIDLTDHYEIDREKVLTLSQRILRRF